MVGSWARGKQEEPKISKTRIAVTYVHGNGVDGVVNAQSNDQFGHAEVDPSTDDANEDGAPRLDGGAAGRDGHETCQASVHGVAQIVRVVAQVVVAVDSC